MLTGLLPRFVTRPRHVDYQEQPYGRIMAIMTPLFLLTVATGVMTFQLVHFQPAQAMDATNNSGMLVAFQAATVRIAQQLQVGTLDPGQRLSLSIGLRPQYEDELTDEIQQESEQPDKRADISERFWPAVGTFRRVERTLMDAGFTITGSYDHALFLTFSGTARQAELFFHVALDTYHDGDMQKGLHTLFYANASPPLVPVWMAQEIVSINGLNNIAQWQRAPYYSSTVAPQLTEIQSATGASLCPKEGTNGMAPDQFASVYGMDGLYQQHNEGEGQSIALFELGVVQEQVLKQALKAYTSCFGQSRTPVSIEQDKVVKQLSDDATNETLLDAELVLGMVPKLGVLHIYAANDNENSYLTQWARILQDAPDVVSTSWGQCETHATPQVIEQENIFFQVAALQRQSIVAATGDGSQQGCAGAARSMQAGVDDPSTQPFVTSVGGTMLTTRMLKGQQVYRGEAAWDPMNVASQGTNADGGMSQLWAAPAWQHMFGITNAASNQTQPCQQQRQVKSARGSLRYCREIPDVALNADPNHGYMLYCAGLSFCSNKKPWAMVGGTSAVAPLWAAFVAQTNEQAHKVDRANEGFLDSRLYAIANDAVAYSEAFHDVTIGNTGPGDGAEDYPATVGYDMTTGLGSMNATALAKKLVGE